MTENINININENINININENIKMSDNMNNDENNINNFKEFLLNKNDKTNYLQYLPFNFSVFELNDKVNEINNLLEKFKSSIYLPETSRSRKIFDLTKLTFSVYDLLYTINPESTYNNDNDQYESYENITNKQLYNYITNVLEIYIDDLNYINNEYYKLHIKDVSVLKDNLINICEELLNHLYEISVDMHFNLNISINNLYKSLLFNKLYDVIKHDDCDCDENDCVCKNKIEIDIDNINESDSDYEKIYDSDSDSDMDDSDSYEDIDYSDIDEDMDDSDKFVTLKPYYNENIVKIYFYKNIDDVELKVLSPIISDNGSVLSYDDSLLIKEYV